MIVPTSEARGKVTTFGAVFGTIWAGLMAAAVYITGQMWDDRRWAWPWMVWSGAVAVAAGGISYVFYTIR